MFDAHIDPWMTVSQDTVDHTIDRLFGFALHHPVLGGLSWVLSSPVLTLSGNCAVTESGRRYRLGRRLADNENLSQEGWAAYRMLVEPWPVEHDEATRLMRWLTAQKISRWLNVPPPPIDDATAVDAFLNRHGTEYLAINKGNRG